MENVEQEEWRGARKHMYKSHFRLPLKDVLFLNLSLVMYFVFQPAECSFRFEINSAVFMAAFPELVSATQPLLQSSLQRIQFLFSLVNFDVFRMFIWLYLLCPP